MSRPVRRRSRGAILLSAVLLFALLAGLSHGVMRLCYPLKYQASVAQYSAVYDVPPALLYAVIRTESSFHPDAVSAADARGLTQITPETFAWLCTKTGEDPDAARLYDPETSIRYGALFLGMLLAEFGEAETALAAYHAGRGRVNGWLKDPACSADGVRLHTVPVRETAHYIKKVTHALRIYINLYSDLKG